MKRGNEGQNKTKIINRGKVMRKTVMNKKINGNTKGKQKMNMENIMRGKISTKNRQTNREKGKK